MLMTAARDTRPRRAGRSSHHSGRMMANTTAVRMMDTKTLKLPMTAMAPHAGASPAPSTDCIAIATNHAMRCSAGTTRMSGNQKAPRSRGDTGTSHRSGAVQSTDAAATISTTRSVAHVQRTRLRRGSAIVRWRCTAVKQQNATFSPSPSELRNKNPWLRRPCGL